MSLFDVHPLHGDVCSLASARLRTMMRGRPVFVSGYEAAVAQSSKTPKIEFELRAAAVLTLANVNAGPAALLAAFRLTANASAPRAFASVADMLDYAAIICRLAGAGATRASLDAYRDLD